MAQRFGGKYSPKGPSGTDAPNLKIGQSQPQPQPQANPFDDKRPFKAGARSTLLFLLALAFLPAAFTGTPDQLLMNLGATGLMLLGAWLTREGLRADMAFAARAIARRPAFPRKIFGAVLTGLSLALATFAVQGGGLVFPALFGALGAALHLGSFGIDPLKSKGFDDKSGIDAFQSDRIARAVEEAERHLTAIEEAITPLRDRELTARVGRFTAVIRKLLRTVEDDPRDLTAARKYLSVYLQGARDATTKFVALCTRNRDEQARGDYLALLDEMETTYAARSQTLLSDNRTDLDIEIGVLRDRLKRET